MQTPKKPGGWSSIRYVFRQSRKAGGIGTMWKAMRSKNTCKTCAVGMGGQKGGMVNESGHFPEFCKKSIQAMQADLQPAIESSFWTENPIDKLRQASPRELEACGRLSQPVVYTRGSKTFTPVSWDDALTRISDKLGATLPDESFFYFSGRSSNEAAFLLQLFARLYGTNNVNNCSFYCHQASGVGISSVIGSGTATVVLEDLDKADLVFLIGANPASNHPRLMRSLMNVRRNGGDVIIINPIREAGLETFSIPSDPRSLLFGSPIASDFIQPHIGGDVALLSGIAKGLMEMDAVDLGFLSRHTTGSDKLIESITAMPWEHIVRDAGVAQAEIESIAARYASSENTIFAWAMGITHHQHGTVAVQLIAALALMRGMIGKKGSGLMPIRGHSNVQGIGSVGVTPVLKDAIFTALTEKYDLDLPSTPGLDTMACMEAATSGQVKVGFCLGGNLYGSNPDLVYASKALSSLDLLVTMSTTLNTGHPWSLAEETLILPVLARDEEPQKTSQESMFNYVRLSDGGPPRIGGPRSEMAIIADLASRVQQKETSPALNALNWSAMNDSAAIREMIGHVIPGWESMHKMNASSAEFQIEGRTFHTPTFNTTSGKAHIQPLTLPELAECQSPHFRLMTIRSEGQFNTVVYEDEDIFRGAPSRDVVLMHPADLSSLQLTEGQRITVEGPAGRLPFFQVISFERIKPGNVAMYFPEANVLLDRRLDPLSKTPAFKGALVKIYV
ncbi:MAG: FdhF/YdeP family oxidoreductase [Bacteroidetes Order II. Incertae sedis bacterium]|jgi:molybdopterin-dependent oxidoreductase alpha subunit|nr:FdhF/YdeP family oxidoreductase [Bacteroidetes Order II. bacterium]MBT5249492.1 FdhF/YdeP family oxidoreductase [Bacteroidetes Order II. bacterium]MBT7401451.1 FdhF/YdeP family oxidoreductase [Bacteroidetes Order II. bacterium]